VPFVTRRLSEGLRILVRLGNAAKGLWEWPAFVTIYLHESIA
jgi:hypothetical protein